MNMINKKELDLDFNTKAETLKSAIGALPKDTVYRAQAQAVLDYVKSLKNGGCQCCVCCDIPVQTLKVQTLNEVLDQAIELINPETAPERRLEILDKCQQTATQFESKGKMGILKGLMFALAAVVCLAVVVAAVVLLTFYTGLGHTALQAAKNIIFGLIFGAEFGTIFGIASIIGAAHCIYKGAQSLGLSKSLSGFLTEARKGDIKVGVDYVKADSEVSQDLLVLGTAYIKDNQVDLGLKCLSQVPLESPGYKAAQLILESYNSTPTYNKNSPEYIGSF
jgi:hypothetical protein